MCRYNFGNNMCIFRFDGEVRLTMGILEESLQSSSDLSILVFQAQDTGKNRVYKNAFVRKLQSGISDLIQYQALSISE